MEIECGVCGKPAVVKANKAQSDKYPFRVLPPRRWATCPDNHVTYLTP